MQAVSLRLNSSPNWDPELLQGAHATGRCWCVMGGRIAERGGLDAGAAGRPCDAGFFIEDDELTLRQLDDGDPPGKGGG